MLERNIPLLQWTSFAKGLYFQTPILSLYFLDHGVSVAMLVAANIFWSVGAFFGEVPTGIFADRFGQRRALIAGYGCEAVGILLALLAPSPATLILYFLREPHRRKVKGEQGSEFWRLV
jgi:MFS family permease